MSLTRPIPKEAEDIAAMIRAEVPRPKSLPESALAGPSMASLRWPHPMFALCCPMGFLPAAENGEPSDYGCFAEGAFETEANEAIWSFGQWWDEQTDPQAAVDAVWGAR